jgi:hypothetical protein
MSGLSPINPSAAAGPTVTLPPGMQSAAESNAFGGIGGLSSYNQYNPTAALGFTNMLTNNPFTGQFQQGAAQAANLGGAGANNIFGGAQQLQGGAGAVLNTAFDPQQALYQRYLQQLQQQSQANYAQSGVGSSPYAAGLMDQNLQNFNTTWQAQQLANQVAGLNAATGAQGAATSMYGAAPNLAFQSAAYPYTASSTIANQGMMALSQLLGYGQAGAQLPQQQIGDYISLLGLQPPLAQAQNQTATTQANLQALQLKELGAGIGTAASLGQQGFSSLSNLPLSSLPNFSGPGMPGFGVGQGTIPGT